MQSLYTIGFNIPPQIIFSILMVRPPHRFQYKDPYVFHIHITQPVSI